jgi:hypothetical protein
LQGTPLFAFTSFNLLEVTSTPTPDVIPSCPRHTDFRRRRSRTIPSSNREFAADATFGKRENDFCRAAAKIISNYRPLRSKFFTDN